MKNIPSFTTFASLVFAYITLSGCLWHLGYWSTFKFNFLEFANISDIFKSTVYPFFKNFWIFFGISFIGIGTGAIMHYSNLGKKYIPDNTSALTYKKIAAFLIAISGFTCFFFSGNFFSGKANYVVFLFLRLF